VSHIVAFESWQAHDVEGCVDCPNLEFAEGLVLSCRDVNNVVILRDLEEVLLNAEVKVREVSAAYELDLTFNSGVINADSCEELFHHAFEIKLRDHDVRGRNVENGVHAG